MNRKQTLTTLLIATGLIPLVESGALAATTPTRIYVDSYAHGANNGSNWANAFLNLQDALAVPVPSNGNEIWVAAGTYYPANPLIDGEYAITMSFVLKANVKIYGGFLGTRHASGGETDISQRDFETNPTILSGDIFEPLGSAIFAVHRGVSAYRRSLHVLVVDDGPNVPAPRLDGFTATKGQAVVGGSGSPWSKGGGLYSRSREVRIANCRFIDNEAKTGGGAVSFDDPNYWTLPFVENCKFISNRTDGNGGAIDFSGMGLALHNCEFRNNSAAGNGGALAYYFDPATSYSGQDLELINCLLAQNNAGGVGGAIDLRGESVLRLFSSTVAHNQAAGAGGGVYNQPNGGGNITYTWAESSIVWGNRGLTGFTEKDQVFANQYQAGFSYCLVQGWTGTSWPSGGTIGGNPRFVAYGDYQLTVGSPCIDAGTQLEMPNDWSDIDGDGDTSEILPDLLFHPRIVDHSSTANTGFENSVIDMGCYELLNF